MTGRRRTGVLAICLAGSIALAGCAQQPPDYPAATAQQLREQTLEVTRAGAAGDFEAALTRLDELGARADDALARGELTEHRHRSIRSAIELVRADLVAALDAAQPDPAPAPDPEPAPAEDPVDDSPGNNGDGAPDDKPDDDKGKGTSGEDRDDKGNEGDDGDKESEKKDEDG